MLADLPPIVGDFAATVADREHWTPRQLARELVAGQLIGDPGDVGFAYELAEYQHTVVRELEQALEGLADDDRDDLAAGQRLAELRRVQHAARALLEIDLALLADVTLQGAVADVDRRREAAASLQSPSAELTAGIEEAERRARVAAGVLVEELRRRSRELEQQFGLA